MIEQKAYRDTWGKGLDSYLQWFYETVILLRELLAENGSIYVHCDSRVNSGVRFILDEIFGSANFLSEVIWLRTSSTGSNKAISKKFPSNHDTILSYSKSDKYAYNRQFKPYSAEYLTRFKYNDQNGRGFYRISDLNSYSQETFERLKSENKLIYPK